MSPLARTTGFAGLAAGLGIAFTTMLPSAGQSPPAVVTTDTEAYCQQLAEKFRELIRIAPRPPQAEVLTMGNEGAQLCEAGQIRGGILRLRRGVKLMLQAVDERGEP